MSDALAYTRGANIHRLLGVRNYFDNYSAMYKRLTRSRLCVELASPAYAWNSHPPPTRRARIPHLPGVMNYLNNYFAMFILLTGSSIRLELPSPTYLGLGII